MTPRLQHPRRAPSRATLTALRQHMEHALVAGGEVSDAIAAVTGEWYDS